MSIGLGINQMSAQVMIVDDEPANRAVLVNLMKAMGHKAITASSGAAALELVRERVPDVILLDISMPGMDGYDTLRQIKQIPAAADVPVIMVSGLEEYENTARCLKLGADDYLSKPYHSSLLKARLEACLRRKLLKDMEIRHRAELEELNQSLERRVWEKNRDLIEARRRLEILDQTKREFLELISHQLRTPVTGLLGVADLLLDSDEVDLESRQEFAELYSQSRDILLNILDEALLLTQVQTADSEIRRQECRLGEALKTALTKSIDFAGSQGIELVCPGDPPVDETLDANFELLVKALATIIKVGVVFSKPKTKVILEWSQLDNGLRLDVQASGEPVEEETLDRVWEIFLNGRCTHPATELRLGPPLAARIVELFNGAIQSLNTPNGPRFQTSFFKLAEP